MSCILCFTLMCYFTNLYFIPVASGWNLIMTLINNPVFIVWFRQDLRLSDNNAWLYGTCKQGKILPIYILDDKNSGQWQMGAASRWWLYHSLKSLNHQLSDNLCHAKGCAFSIIEQLVQELPVAGVYWNRCYEPWRINRDVLIKNMLKHKGIDVQSFSSSLLLEPHKLLKDDKQPYKVFTPLYKKFYCDKNIGDFFHAKASKSINYYQHNIIDLEELGLLPEKPWYLRMEQVWNPGESGAQARMQTFLASSLSGYKEGRDYPDLGKISGLSPHLHFGELSPRQVWCQVEENMSEQRVENDGRHFLRELVWREFSYSLLYHNPDMPTQNIHKKFDQFSWIKNAAHLKKWQSGQTGYPFVDAGMRELWETGSMHNRVRMVVASFLTKQLLIHWRCGQEWFWDTLVDADLANNSASWQWVAGSGADAAPYFRIFNPVTQGKKFDPEGLYVRRYVPEIRLLPNKYIHCPWEASEQVLKSSGVALGETYPNPIIDLKYARERALNAYTELAK